MIMDSKKWLPVVRWMARIWSLGPILFGLANVLSPETESDIFVPWTDWLALSLMGICLIGLAVAWRWEKVGAWITLVTLVVFTVVFVLTVERVFPTLLIILLALGTPALMFLAISQPDE
jgi:hypothetical protein